MNDQQLKSGSQFDKNTILLWILVGIIALAGYFAWQWWETKKELNNNLMKIKELQTQIEKLQQKGPKLEELLNSNSEFKEFFDKIIDEKLTLKINKFTITESKPINVEYGYPISEEAEKDLKENIAWEFSPDQTKAVSILLDFGEPDSSLYIYNRKGNKEIERFKFCGTPCAYWDIFWLNNEKFIFVQNHEYYPSNGEIRCTVDTICTYIVDISLYDLNKNTEVIYQSQEIDQSLRNKIIYYSENTKKLCQKLYGKECWIK